MVDPLRFERRMQPYRDCVFAGYKPGVLPLNYGSGTIKSVVRPVSLELTLYRLKSSLCIVTGSNCQLIG